MLREALESDLVILKRVYQRLQAKQHRNILCVRIRPITTQSYNALTVSLIPLIPLWTFLSRRYVMSNQRKAERFRVLFNFACRSYTGGCFEKGCRKKCTQQSRKVLWVVLSSLFFNDIWKNDERGHGSVFASANGKQQNYKFDSYSVRNSVLIISHIIFRDCRVHIFLR